MASNHSSLLSRRSRRLVQFHQDRARCIGGSDAVHLVDQPPYGCKRRLMYDKLGVPADYPFEGNVHTERGIELESLAAKRYRQETGRIVVGVAHRTHPQYPWMGCHADRIIRATRTRPKGLLEIKCPTFRNYQRIKAAGLPDDYFLQLQWGIAVWELTWGSVCVFSAETMKPLVFDHARDDGVIGNLVTIGADFWLARRNLVDAFQYEDLPYPRITPPDKRCLGCPWRTTCQGLGAVPQELTDEEKLGLAEMTFEPDPSLASVFAAWLQLKRESKEAADATKEVEKELKEKLAGRNVDCGLGKVWIGTVNRKGYTVQPCTYPQLKYALSKPEDL